MMMSLSCALFTSALMSSVSVIEAAENIQLQQNSGMLSTTTKKSQSNISVQRQRQKGIIRDNNPSHSSMSTKAPSSVATPAKEKVIVSKEKVDTAIEAAVNTPITGNKASVEASNEALMSDSEIIEQAAESAVPQLEQPALKGDGSDKLWNLYTAGEFKALKQQIADNQQKDANWEAPGGLLDLMKLVAADDKLAAAQKKGDYKVALDLYKRSPQTFGCDRLGWALFLAEGQMRSGKRSESLATYDRILKKCNNIQKVSALEHALGVLPSRSWQLRVQKELKLKYTGKEYQRREVLRYKMLLQRLQTASDKNKMDMVERYADKLDPLVRKHNDPLAAEIVGWAYFKGKKYDKALKEFNYSYKKTENPDALRGKLFCLARLKLFSDLDTLVKAKKKIIIKAGLMDDVLPILAGNALTQKKYSEALQLLNDLKKIRPLTMAEMNMYGWSNFHYGNYAVATDTFESLYRMKQDDVVARGLYYSANRLGDKKRLRSLSDEFGGRFLALVKDERNDALYNREQFLVVYENDPDYSDSLKNIDKPYVRAAYMAKFLQGAPIFSRMVLRKEILEGRDVIDGVNELNIRIEHLNLDAGAGAFAEPLNPLLPADPGFNVGTMTVVPGQVAYAIPTPRTRHSGFEWSIGMRHEDEGTVYGEVGQVVVKSAIKNDFKFKLGYERKFDGRSVQVEAYRQPLRETMISYLGMTDPYQGIQKWGQVSRNGVSLTGYQALQHNFSVSGNALVESRRGHNVVDNTHMGAYGGLNYNIAVPGFNYFSVGPYTRWEKSDMNQNHYTIGHGDYFSPQYLLDWGIATSMMTETGKRWLVKADASFGKQTINRSAELYFPLTNNAGTVVLPNTYLGQRNTEYHYQYDISVILALADRWRLQGEFKQARSWSLVPLVGPQRAVMERSFMVSLKYHFGDRGLKLLRKDFPAYGLNPLY
ncbi:hypothetical protein D8Y20_13150 [Mariprofundus sp. EBB-1]|nr:hypothetical protein D8Y20_13150 [Mariprofundus sp. EBB-1]